MDKQDLKRLEKIEDRIKQLMDEWGLKCCPVEFDIIPPEKMIEIMAYGIPTNVSNWKYGRDWERIRTIYEKVSANVPYEVVIANNPARAYLMNNNLLPIQALVISHVYLHVNFFTENKFFKFVKDDIVEYMSRASEKLNRFERAYGVDEVERIVDAGHSIAMHSSPFEPEPEDVRRKKLFEQMKKTSRGDIRSEFGDVNRIKKSNEPEVDAELYNQHLWRTLKNKSPIEPTEDILRYIIDNSRALEDWQKEVLEILRVEGQYVWPLIRTKYMNEGWACITGDSLVHTENGFVNIIDAQEHCKEVVGINKKLVDINERYITKKIKTIKIKTNIGTALEGAEMHRILTPQGDVFLKDLKVGDEVLASIGLDIWPKDEVEIDIDYSLKRQNFSRSQYVSLPKKINNDVAYLMGSLVSEGHIGRRVVKFTNQDGLYLNEIKKIWKEQFDKSVEVYDRNNSDTKDIEVYSTTIIDYLEQAGLKTVKSGLKEIPWSILQSPKHAVSSFIAGFFDGDGCVYYNGKSSRQVIFTSKSEKLIRQFIILLLNYGIRGYFATNKKRGYEDCYQLRITRGECLKTFFNEIPFRNSHKRELLKKCIDTLVFTHKESDICTITSIEEGENVNYDWSIPEGEHYVAQGFINHNTFGHQKVMGVLFKEGLLYPEKEFEAYNRANSWVKAFNPFSMNPYQIGSKMWEDIEMRWNKGRHGTEYDNCTDWEKKTNWDTKEGKGWEKCKEVMRISTDWMFMKSYLTEELVRDLKLYLYIKQKEGDDTVYRVAEKDYKEVKDIISKSFIHSSVPKIEVIDGSSGALILKHAWGGIPLDEIDRDNTLRHIMRLWGDDVLLVTKIKDPQTGEEKDVNYISKYPKLKP